MSMKAWNLHGVDDIRFEEVSEPTAQPGWAVVEVKAAGVCGSDIPRIFKNGTYHFPTIPGHEFAGVVREVCECDDISLAGKRVGVYPLIPCMHCAACQTENFEMCDNYNYLGSRTDGGFAERVRVPLWNIIELPDLVTFEEAAMLEPLSVGIHALRRLPLSRVNSIVITGLGPIGLMMAQTARAMHIENVLLIGNKPEQAELAASIGFNNVFIGDSQVTEWIKSKTGGAGVDVAADCVGSNEVFALCLETVKAGGDVLIVGNPRDDLRIDRNTYWKIHRKQLNLHGTWNSSFGLSDADRDDWKYALSLLENGSIDISRLITHKFTLEDLSRGFDIMRDKSEFFCKVMSLPDATA